MSNSGCEAIPIESPSSIQSDSPSELVRRKNDTASRSSSTAAGSTKLFGSDRTLGRGRNRSATLANSAILVSGLEGPAQSPDCGRCGSPMTSSGASLVAVLPAAPPVGANGLALGQSERPAGGTVRSRHLPLVATSR